MKQIMQLWGNDLSAPPGVHLCSLMRLLLEEDKNTLYSVYSKFFQSQFINKLPMTYLYSFSRKIAKKLERMFSRIWSIL